METGPENAIKSPSGTSIAIIDRACSVMKGMELDLKLCGIPMTVLEMLIGVNPLFSEEDIVGGALRDSRAQDCLNLVMVELWSKNVGSGCNSDGTPMDGGWIHWVLPKTMRWELSSTLEFSNGPLEVSLSGYAEQSDAWYPSLPGEDFPSYVPGSGDPAGWPTGVAGPVLPPGIAADPWTLQDQEVIRTSGPLAWRSVGALPAPLDDCDYLYSPTCVPEVFTEDFCGEAGPIGAPWVIPFDPPESEVPSGPLILTGDCSVEVVPGASQIGLVPMFDEADCCGQSCQVATVSGEKAFFNIEEGVGFGVGGELLYSTDTTAALGVIIYGFSNGSSLAAIQFLIGLNNDITGTAVAVGAGFQYIPLSIFNSPRYSLSLSWCEDGSFVIRFSSGSFSQTWSIPNVRDFYAGSFDTAGMILSPFIADSPLQASGFDSFSLVCDSLSSGDFEILLEAPAPGPSECEFYNDWLIDASPESVFTVQTNWYPAMVQPCDDSILTWHDYYYVQGIGDPRPGTIDFSAPGWVSMGPEHDTPLPMPVSVPSNILIASKLLLDGVETGLSLVAHFPDTFSSVDTSDVYFAILSSTAGGTASWVGPVAFAENDTGSIQEILSYPLP